ncbi:MAG: LapA family protein [Cellvibrionales bacterium]|nr:LapA family protein [Cellvibrionales bacterium]
MRWLKLTLTAALCVAAFLTALVFLASNEAPVTVHLLILSLPATLGAAILASFVAGILLTLLASSPLIFWLKLRLRRTRRQLAKHATKEPPEKPPEKPAQAPPDSPA